MKKKLGNRFWLIVSLAMMLVGMIFANAVQSSFGSVKIQDLVIAGTNGKKINAKMFIPKDASTENKLPLIVCQHGSQHNFEMQDMNYVELSRRGYVVIAPDAYGHGSSASREGLAQAAAFTTDISVIDYAYDNFDFIDKNKIGVMGHSMGAAYASTTLQYYVTQEALGKGPNKVTACLEVGYDPAYDAYKIEGVNSPVYADANWGVIAGKYDEYFFRQPDVGNNPANILKSAAALRFVQQVDSTATGPVEDGKVYKGTINGKQVIRVFNQNPEIHPQNIFSRNTSADTTRFFYDALGTPSGHEVISPDNQVWQWKQFFNGFGLAGLFIFLFPFAQWIMDTVPYFAVLKLKEGEVREPAPALDTPKKKFAFILTYVLNMAIPAVLAMPVMHYWIGKQSFAPTTANRWFGDGAVTELAGWSIVAGACLLLVFYLNYRLVGKKSGMDFKSCIKISWSDLWRSFLLALLTFTACCAILWFADYWFNTDFRLWLIAFRIFEPNRVMYWIAYLPAFIFFYLVNALLVDAGNRVKGMPDWAVTLISCIANVLGIVVLISIQYIVYSKTGVYPFNAMRTHNLFPLVVIVPIATIICRHYFKETGKIYLGAFTVAMLITMMTIVQTTMTFTIFG